MRQLSAALREFARGARQGASRAIVRPTLDDVERLARGDATKRRGIGSRRIPHRLNMEERRAYEVALRTGYAVLDGSGHRRHKDAKGTPLLNILRQRADALSRPLVWVERHRSGSFWHACVDYSPVRCTLSDELSTLHARTLELLAAEATPCAFTDAPWLAHGRDADRANESTELEFSHDDEQQGSNNAGVSRGAAPLLGLEDLTRPIWALPAIVARFGFVREDEAHRKACKRFAKVLAREFSS